jgi:2',3'-cyclic-nucleotide 2'-phosphodiesterase / 3'-nucleotidase
MPQAETQTDHPVITAMNTLEYDAATLGNHDLDFGPEHLAKALAKKTFPIVSANVRLPPELLQIKRYVILERTMAGHKSPLRIGVTGILPPETLESPAAKDPSIVCEPVRPALARVLAEMKEAGADITIVLAHCAVGSEARPESGTALSDTLSVLQKADLVLAGHTHEVCPRPDASLRIIPGADFPALIPGAWGEHLGQADLSLERSNNRWHIRETQLSTERTAANAPECPEIVAALAGHHSATLAAVAEPLGQTTGQIDSFFTLVQDNASLHLLAEAFEESVRQAVRGTAIADVPVLSVIAPFRTGGRAGPWHYCHIPKGTIAQRDLDKLYSFHDTLCALRISGKALRLWLEASASVFSQVPVGAQDAPLLNGTFPGYLFDVIPQLEYEIDISRPAVFNAERRRVSTGQGRITSLSYKGKTVCDDAIFTLAASSYRAQTFWPDIPEALRPQLILDTGEPCRNVLGSYIRSKGTIRPATSPSWRFKPMPHTSALFLTSPKAASSPAKGIEFIRHTPFGFAEMRLSLSGTGCAQTLANPAGASYIGQ